MIGGLGLLRLPDFYTRTHGASITDTLGANGVVIGLIVAELSLVEANPLFAAKMFLLLVFLFLASPTSGHALVKAAYARGVRWDETDGDDDAVSH
jgi:multicomponent Na+:H+ antiporter subunit G